MWEKAFEVILRFNKRLAEDGVEEPGGGLTWTPFYGVSLRA